MDTLYIKVSLDWISDLDLNKQLHSCTNIANKDDNLGFLLSYGNDTDSILVLKLYRFEYLDLN